MSPRPMFSTFTHSVGAHAAGHSLPSKLRAIASAGFEGVEIFQDDLDAYMNSEEFSVIYKCQTPPDSPSHSHSMLQGEAEPGNSNKVGSCSVPQANGSKGLKTAWNAHGPCEPSQVIKEIFCASHIATLCRSLGLKVLTLQPMRDVEGWSSSSDRDAALHRVKSRFPILRALGTDLMIICSNNQHAPATTGDYDAIARDLQELADAAIQYNLTAPYAAATSSSLSSSSSSNEGPIRIAYEALSWGAHVDRWSQAWDVVQRVNRVNVGICFDSFNTLGREFADPCSPSGIQEPESLTRRALEQSLEAIKSVPADKIFFMQVGDARKLSQPLKPSPSEEEPRPARMIWSRANRLYPGEYDQGAFMPVTDFVKAVCLGAGYMGPWSIEVFNSSLDDSTSSVPAEHARRGFQGLGWLSRQVYSQ